MISQNVLSFIQDRYQLYEKLGEGSMGIVYRAYDRFMDQIVALKRVTISTERIDFGLRASVGSNGDYRLALAHEFKTLASLRHPHIISVLDYGFDSDRQPYYTMDLLENSQTLFEAGKAQPEKDKVNLLIQLLQALTYLHRRNILHRDLKPANVLVSAGQVKVLDFGLASAMQDDSKTVGTWTYMAPEVMEGKPSSRSTDLYAVGVIAYQLLTGRYPYAFRTPSQLLNRIMTVHPDCSVIENRDLSEIISRLLEKEPSARYASAEEIIPVLSNAVGQPPPQESIAIRESFLKAAQFVGREAELSTLIDAMEGAAQGKGAVWMIGGESGVGKSRLVDELRTHAMVEGAAILRGQAVEGGGLPYQLWRDPVRRLALSVELSDFEAGIIREWVSDIDALLGRPIPKVPILDGKANSQRFGATMLDIIRRQTRKQPTLLILEDLQWAVEGLDVLKLLIRAVGSLPLFIVGTYQSDVNPYLASELPGTEVMMLGRLSESAIGQLSAQMLGENGRDPDVVGFLQEQTEGNVFFLVEVVRALAESAGRLSMVGTTALPESVFTGGINEIIQRRLNHVPKEDQSLLRLAAIIGRALDLDILHTLASPDRLNASLLNGTGAGVLEVQQGRWSFAHDKLREALIVELGDEEKAQLHRRAAVAIETVYAGDERYASQLLRHWRIAEDLQKEMHYTCIASRQALSMSFYREVLELGEQMFERLEEVDKIPIDSNQKSLLLNLMGDAAASMGNYDRAWQNFEAALAQASAQDDLHNVAMARHGLGVIAFSRTDYETAEKYFTQSLQISREINDQQRILANLYQIGILNRYRGDYEKAHNYYNQSIEIAQEIGDRFGMAKCLNSLGVLAIFQSDYKTAKSYYEQSLAIQKEINDRSGMATSLFNLGNSTENQGEYAQALSYYEQALNMFREIGDLQGEAYCVLGLGNLSVYKGAYQVARTYLKESLSLWRQLGNQRGIASCLKSLGWLALKQGKWKSARRYSEKSLALYKEIGYVFGIGLALSKLGELAYMQGDNETSEAYIKNSMKIYRKLNSQSTISRCYILLGRIAYARKQFEVAQEYYETSLAICREIDEVSSRALGQCQLGFVYIALNDAKAARQALCDALSIAQRIGMLPLILEVLIGFARLYWLEGMFDESIALIEWISRHPLAEVDKDLQGCLKAFRADSQAEVGTRTMDAGELDSEGVVEKILATCAGAGCTNNLTEKG